MKPAKLRHHLETKHKEYVGKPIEFLERKCNELKHTKEETLHFFVPGGIVEGYRSFIRGTPPEC